MAVSDNDMEPVMRTDALQDGTFGNLDLAWSTSPIPRQENGTQTSYTRLSTSESIHSRHSPRNILTGYAI